jgi:hypothetical protein
MIKATATQPDGRTLLLIGLSFVNLDKFRTEAGDMYIKINGMDMDMPIDVLIFSGETEFAMESQIEGLCGPYTEVHIDPRMKKR